jgi:hypothetical protein
LGAAARALLALAVLALAMLAVLAMPLRAAPRYVDKDSALEIAKALDKGIFRGHIISSTFVQAAGREQYRIKVVLDNGTEQDWDLEQLRAWTREGAVSLPGNRILLFPRADSAVYVLFDKNEFARKALRARVLVRRYAEPDPLAGQTIRYSVYQFNLVDLLHLKPGADSQGYRHQYFFDLENGQREFISHLDAYTLMAQNALLEDPGAAGGPVMRSPYQLRAINPRDLQMANGIGRFGLELVFDRPVQLEAGHFPFQIYERSPGGPRKMGLPFVVEFTLPNTVLPAQLPPIKTLEFLNSVAATSDDRHGARVLVRANVNPDVLTQPPEVELKGQSLLLTFVKVQDQTVFDRDALLEADLRRRQDKLLHGTLTPEEAQRRVNYRQFMETGQGQVDRLRTRTTAREKIDLLISALSNFSEAAALSSTDKDLEDAMRERNTITARLPGMVIDYSRFALKEPSPDRDTVRRFVDLALGLTRDSRLVPMLKELQLQLSK